MARCKRRGRTRVAAGCLAMLLGSTGWAGNLMQGVPEVTQARSGLGSMAGIREPSGLEGGPAEGSSRALLKERLAEEVASHLPFPTRFELGEAQVRLWLKDGRPMLQYHKSF